MLSEKSGFKVSLSNMFLVNSSLIARFEENDCYIMIVFGSFVRLPCLLLISGNKFLLRFLEMMMNTVDA